MDKNNLNRRDFLTQTAVGATALLPLGILPTIANAAENNLSSEFKNSKVIVTGGTSGLGKVLVEQFVKLGAQVAFCGRSKEKGNQIEKSLNSKNQNTKFFPADITAESQVKSFINDATNWLGRIDIAINNAGIDYNFDIFEDSSMDENIKVIQTNLLGTMFCLKYEGQAMKKFKKGSIINIGSVADVRGSSSGVAYSASKHGIIGLTKSLAKNYAKYNIRVNAVSPYIMDNQMGKGRVDETDEDVKSSLANMPLKKMITLEAVAANVIWLNSNSAQNITGHNLVIDGGVLA